MEISAIFPDKFDPVTASKSDCQQVLTKILKTAKDDDCSQAFALAGYYYEMGYGAEKDIEKAKEHYNAAAERGCGASAYNLARLYYCDGQFSTAASVLELGVAIGESQAMALLGSMYESGRGVKANLHRAIQLHVKGVEVGNRDSILHLASLLRRGIDIPLGLEEIKKLLEELPQSGDVLYEKALFVSEGLIYVADDKTKAALALAEQAATLGHSLAINWVVEAYALGLGCDQDVSKACHFIELAKMSEKGRESVVGFLRRRTDIAKAISEQKKVSRKKPKRRK